jgi:hypothetical protein
VSPFLRRVWINENLACFSAGTNRPPRGCFDYIKKEPMKKYIYILAYAFMFFLEVFLSVDIIKY